MACDRGRVEELAGHHQAAAKAYRSALTNDEDLLAALFGLWRVAVRDPEHASLDLVAERLKQCFPERLRSALARRMAVRLLDAATRWSPSTLAGIDDAMALEVRAGAEAAAGRSDAAPASWSKLVEAVEGERRVNVLLRLGAWEERAGRLDDARQTYGRAAEAAAGDLTIACAEARVARAQGNSQRVLELIEKLAPGDCGVALEKAQLLAVLGRNEEAQQALAAIVEKYPTHPVALAGLVDGYLAAKQPSDAGALLKRATSGVEDADYANILAEQAARCLARGAKHDAAFEILTELRDGDSSGFICRLEQRLAAECHDVARLTIAMAGEAAKTAAPGRAAILWHRHGLLAEGLNDVARSTSFRKAHELAPDYWPAPWRSPAWRSCRETGRRRQPGFRLWLRPTGRQAVWKRGRPGVTWSRRVWRSAAACFSRPPRAMHGCSNTRRWASRPPGCCAKPRDAATTTPSRAEPWNACSARNSPPHGARPG